MSDIRIINDQEQLDLTGTATNGAVYLKASGSTNAGAIVVYDNGSWRTFANESYSNTYSLQLDGINDHAITSGTPIDTNDMANGYTFSGWVWREDVPSLPSNGGTTNWLGGAYCSATDNATYHYLRWYITDEYWNGGVYKALHWYHGTQEVQNTTTLLPAGVWSHLAVTWDGSSTVTTYLNGSQLSQINYANSLASRTDKMVIGKGNWYHKGLIDEVAYWNSGLSSSDITAIYNSGTPDDLTSYSPVGWWRCGDDDGGTGTTVTDQGSGGHDMTVMNSATFSTSVPS